MMQRTSQSMPVLQSADITDDLHLAGVEARGDGVDGHSRARADITNIVLCNSWSGRHLKMTVHRHFGIGPQIRITCCAFAPAVLPSAIGMHAS
jgi:hypothetical protein